ncbi:MAG: transporter substrate-binding domain-containing protein, partial [Nocardioidaceae bacterium]
MNHPGQVLIAGLAVAATLATASCGGGSDDDSDSAFGSCEVYGKEGSISIEPVTADVLTVQTTLPSPGWWKGTSPESIDGGYEYCLAANLAHRAGLEEVRVVNQSFDALVAGQTQDFDIALAQVSITPEREKVVEFSEPYFDSNIGVLTAADSGVTADNVTTKNLGVQLGTTSVDFVESTLQPDSDP